MELLNEERKKLTNSLQGLQSTVENFEPEITRYRDIITKNEERFIEREKEYRKIIDNHQQRITEAESLLDKATNQNVQLKTDVEKLRNELSEHRKALDKTKENMSYLTKLEETRDRLIKRVDKLEELANNK